MLDFSRDRKMMSVLVSGGGAGAFALFTKATETVQVLHLSVIGKLMRVLVSGGPSGSGGPGSGLKCPYSA